MKTSFSYGTPQVLVQIGINKMTHMFKNIIIVKFLQVLARMLYTFHWMLCYWERIINTYSELKSSFSLRFISDYLVQYIFGVNRNGKACTINFVGFHIATVIILFIKYI